MQFLVDSPKILFERESMSIRTLFVASKFYHKLHFLPANKNVIVDFSNQFNVNSTSRYRWWAHLNRMYIFSTKPRGFPVNVAFR